VLLGLWLYATSEGVDSARHVARLCERDDAYRWICGGLTPNHHTLSDFRVQHGAKLDELLTQVLACLMNAKVLRLRRLAQDGTRVRANAGAASFRRGSTLERCHQEAKGAGCGAAARARRGPRRVGGAGAGGAGARGGGASRACGAAEGAGRARAQSASELARQA